MPADPRGLDAFHEFKIPNTAFACAYEPLAGQVAFVALVVATVAAFFITQHLKVTTPLIAGDRAPFPATINPRGRRDVHRRDPTDAPRTPRELERSSFFLLHRSDDVDVYIVNQSGRVVATLATAAS